MDLSKLSDEELTKFENDTIAEYNKITQPYRLMFAKISEEHKLRREKKVNSCNHVWEKDAGCYHNDRIYFCTKCGVEK